MPVQTLLTILRAADADTAEAAEARARAFCDNLTLSAGRDSEGGESLPLLAALRVASTGAQRTIGGYLVPVVGETDGEGVPVAPGVEDAPSAWREAADAAAAPLGLSVVSVRPVPAV